MRSFVPLGLFLIFNVVFCLVLIYYWEEIKELGRWDYPFIFLISFIAGSSLPVPAPQIIVVFAMASVLNPLLVGLVSGLGAGVGGTMVYFFGRGGRWFFYRINSATMHGNGTVSRWTDMITRWAKNKGSLVVFLMSALFNPAFAPMALAMGAVRFNAVKFFLLCCAGNIMKSMVIAYAGYLGLGFLFRCLGINT
ncbi:MAG: VTT domain-containing protein [Chloroflexota bacterium]